MGYLKAFLGFGLMWAAAVTAIVGTLLLAHELGDSRGGHATDFIFTGFLVLYYAAYRAAKWADTPEPEATDSVSEEGEMSEPVRVGPQ